MATISIGIAKPEDSLPRNIIKVWCGKCRDSTKHYRIIREKWRVNRKRVPATKTAPSQPHHKNLWACKECGEVVNF